eukprot:ctg_497.g158
MGEEASEKSSYESLESRPEYAAFEELRRGFAENLEKRTRLRQQAMSELQQLEEELNRLAAEANVEMPDEKELLRFLMTQPARRQLTTEYEEIRTEPRRPHKPRRHQTPSTSTTAAAGAASETGGGGGVTGWAELQSGDDNDDDDDDLDAFLAMDETHRVLYTGAPTPALEDTGTNGWEVEEADFASDDGHGDARMIVQCNANGCSLIVRDDPHVPTSNRRGVRARCVHSGPGFRIGYDPQATYWDCALVGDDHWTIALNREEFRHFRRLGRALAYKMSDIASGRIPRPSASGKPVRSDDGTFHERLSVSAAAGATERLTVELESNLLWLGGLGDPTHYDLRLVLLGKSRKAEGTWPAAVVPSLLAKLMELEEPLLRYGYASSVGGGGGDDDDDDDDVQGLAESNSRSKPSLM